MAVFFDEHRATLRRAHFDDHLAAFRRGFNGSVPQDWRVGRKQHDSRQAPYSAAFGMGAAGRHVTLRGAEHNLLGGGLGLFFSVHMRPEALRPAATFQKGDAHLGVGALLDGPPTDTGLASAYLEAGNATPTCTVSAKIVGDCLRDDKGLEVAATRELNEQARVGLRMRVTQQRMAARHLGWPLVDGLVGWGPLLLVARPQARLLETTVLTPHEAGPGNTTWRLGCNAQWRATSPLRLRLFGSWTLPDLHKLTLSSRLDLPLAPPDKAGGAHQADALWDATDQRTAFGSQTPAEVPTLGLAVSQKTAIGRPFAAVHVPLTGGNAFAGCRFALGFTFGDRA